MIIIKLIYRLIRYPVTSGNNTTIRIHQRSIFNAFRGIQVPTASRLRHFMNISLLSEYSISMLCLAYIRFRHHYETLLVIRLQRSTVIDVEPLAQLLPRTKFDLGSQMPFLHNRRRPRERQGHQKKAQDRDCIRIRSSGRMK